LYHIIFFGLSLLGNFPGYQGAFAFHLLDISFQNDQVRNVFKSVTENGSNLLLTALLGISLIYCYSMIGFYFFRDMYDLAGVDCSSVFSCTVNTIDNGIRNGGGIGDALGTVDWLDTRFVGRWFFDISFYIVIIIIILNVVFGIILDTFGALRDEKNEVEEEMRNKCFVCGIGANTFQQKALGFTHHIKHDHKLWNYLYFFIYLELKDKDEFTAAEEYVYEKRQNGDIAYFPIDKAICLLKKKKDKKGKKKDKKEKE